MHILKTKMFLTSFLIIAKIWQACLRTLSMSGQTHQKDINNLKKTLVLVSKFKINFITHFFLEILQRYYIDIFSIICVPFLLGSIWRSSCPEVFCKKGVIRIFTKFTGKHMCQSHFSIKLQTQACNLKKRLWHRCFPVNFAKFLKTPF